MYLLIAYLQKMRLNINESPGLQLTCYEMSQTHDKISGSRSGLLFFSIIRSSRM